MNDPQITLAAMRAGGSDPPSPLGILRCSTADETCPAVDAAPGLVSLDSSPRPSGAETGSGVELLPFGLLLGCRLYLEPARIPGLEGGALTLGPNEDS